MNPSSLPWKKDAWLGRCVVVTGSGRGIGQGCARFFAKHEAKVLLVARSQSEPEATHRELLHFTMECDYIALDLTEGASAAKVVERAKSNWGGLDIVIANAGAAAQGGSLELPDDTWLQGFDLKMFANLRVIREAWPSLRESRSHVVLIGGGTAKTPERHIASGTTYRGT
jgi:3-oxoacyl-[acyl-carrier protein] reductase